jgi:hypothetical protein
MTGTQRRFSALAKRVEKVVNNTPVFDIHTHLYDPAFKRLLLWGIDDLLVYHYLVAEAFRFLDLPYDKFWALSKVKQAEVVWEALFARRTPISEACQGVLTTLNLMGLEVKKRDLRALRKWFARQRVDAHVTRCLELAGVEKICMTNSPFDDLERPLWEEGFRRDERFVAALRIDPLLVSWNDTVPRLNEWGYRVSTELSDGTIAEVRRFLNGWTQRLTARYVMVSLPPDFRYPDAGTCAQLIERAVLPHCAEFGVPLALMLGAKRAVNPHLRLAGDGVGRSDLQALANLCAGHPENKFLVTVLARENQHELCVLARKFRNLHVFGCWWFTNVPSVVDEITRMRLELVGLSVTPQHSDARVLDQLVYKWHHFRRSLAQVLVEKYVQLARTGWDPKPAEIERDVKALYGGEFLRFCGD